MSVRVKIVQMKTRQQVACIDKTDVGKTPRSVSLREVRLHAVLVIEESDSAQC